MQTWFPSSDKHPITTEPTWPVSTPGSPSLNCSLCKFSLGVCLLLEQAHVEGITSRTFFWVKCAGTNTGAWLWLESLSSRPNIHAENALWIPSSSLFFCLFSIKWCQHLRSPFLLQPQQYTVPRWGELKSFLQPEGWHCVKRGSSTIASHTENVMCAWHLSKHIISVVDFISLSPSHLRMYIRLGPQEEYNVCIFSCGHLLDWFLWQKLGSPTMPIDNTGRSENSEVFNPWR